MDITIIGSGTCVPSLHRASPCVMVRVAGSTLLCDTGPGTLRQLLHAGATIGDIDMLIYTHFHIDHTADFAPLLFVSKYGPGLERDRSLTVMGPQGLRQWYEHLKAVHGDWIVPDRFDIGWIEAANSRQACSGFTVRTAQVEHSGASMAVRIEDKDGRALVYSGDTDYCEGIVALARHADVLILECSCAEGFKKQGHLVPSLAGRIAREAACKKLVLTHLYPACDEHDLMGPLQRQFSGPAEIARDLMTISI